MHRVVSLGYRLLWFIPVLIGTTSFSVSVCLCMYFRYASILCPGDNCSDVLVPLVYPYRYALMSVKYGKVSPLIGLCPCHPLRSASVWFM